MEIDGDCSKVNKQETRLSGTYIRSLVKHLASSRTKDTMNRKTPDSVVGNDQPRGKSAKLSEGCGETSKNQQTQQPQPHKKQVRRRLHTSRPYQERLLNMAEARREIVTALKQHRAAMKQASEQQKQQLQQQETQPEPMQIPPQTYLEQEARMKSRRNPRIYPLTDFPSCLDSFSCSCFPHHPFPPPRPFSWPASQISSSPASHPLNFVLPNQPLGLNLNLQDFNNIETSLYHNTNNPPIYSSPSSSSSPGVSIASEEIPLMGVSHEVGLTPLSDGADSSGGGGLHPVMDDEEMAEIRSIGEQHQMEWNDTMNFVASAWWFKFLKTMELEPEMKTEDDGCHPFDEVMELPSWLNTNEPYFTDYSSDDYLQDPALPCMEIGEIEGIDGEWLA